MIKAFEGIMDGDSSTVNFDPYLCPAGYWTIGWGHVVRDAHGRMLDKTVPEAEVRKLYPNGVTYAEAEDLLRADLAEAEAGVRELVKVPLNDNQFSALVSFCFNLGYGTVANSTLLKLLNQGDYEGAAEEMPRFKYAGGKVLNGLVNRRRSEQALFRRPLLIVVPPISESRIVVSGTVSLVTTVVLAGAELRDEVEPYFREIMALPSIPEWAPPALLVVLAGLSAFVVYARVRDRRKGYK